MSCEKVETPTKLCQRMKVILNISDTLFHPLDRQKLSCDTNCDLTLSKQTGCPWYNRHSTFTHYSDRELFGETWYIPTTCPTQPGSFPVREADIFTEHYLPTYTCPMRQQTFPVHIIHRQTNFHYALQRQTVFLGNSRYSHLSVSSVVVCSTVW